MSLHLATNALRVKRSYMSTHITVPLVRSSSSLVSSTRAGVFWHSSRPHVFDRQPPKSDLRWRSLHAHQEVCAGDSWRSRALWAVPCRGLLPCQGCCRVGTTPVGVLSLLALAECLYIDRVWMPSLTVCGCHHCTFPNECIIRRNVYYMQIHTMGLSPIVCCNLCKCMYVCMTVCSHCVTCVFM